MGIFGTEFKRIITQSNALVHLIFINLGIFVIYKVLSVFFFLFNVQSSFLSEAVKYLALPASLSQFIIQPWSLFTYMFLHIGFFHVLFNLLWLYWFGNIFQEYLGNKKLLSTYIIGGLAGALLFMLTYNIFPAFKENLPHSYAMGASAGILAIVVATATLLPNYRIGLLFIGEVPLKYVAIATVVIDFLSISEGNAGGHIAHIGGAIYGYFFIRLLRKGYDMGKSVDNISEFVKENFSKKKLKVVHKGAPKGRPISDDEYIAQKRSKQEVMDSILDKISQSGYESLTKAEKEFLFKISKDDK